MDLEVFGWLVGPAGQEALATAARLYAEGTDPIRTGEVMRRGLDGDRAAAATSQAALRAAARTKFGDDAERMYFTHEALEQATHREVATHRAARLALAYPSSVVDLGCGIGGDLVALARAGLLVAGVDLDPLRAAMAEANLAALGIPGAVRAADATALELTPFGAVFVDPARRGARGRVFDPDAYAPSWSFVEHLLRQPALLPRPAVVKAAPGVPHERVPPGVEAEWVSLEGEVKEAALWSPPLATTARRATVMKSSGLATLTAEDDPGRPEVGPVGRYLHEPDGAVIRAGLVGAVATRLEGRLVDEHIAYVTSDRPSPSPYARSYEVLAALPHREKQLRSALRQRGIGQLTIKKRGVAVVPEELRTRLALRGDAVGTLVLTRVAGRGVALLVEPLGPAR